MRRRAVVILAVLSGAGLLASCGSQDGPSPATSTQLSAPPFLATTTIREIMDAEVDPAADSLWDSVATVSTLAGTREQQPRTAQEWQALRRNAITLLEATNLVIMEGRQIAPASTPVAPGELAPAQLELKLRGSRAQFVGYALALRTLSLQALGAIDARDPQRLFAIGGQIDEACETCHLVYWYPPAGSPKT